MKKTTKSLPVVTYHRVNRGSASLTVSPENFENHCKALSDNGWRGVSLYEAENFFLEGEPLPAKSVLLTFDDGYLDNYVYAWPILQKYGHKAVVFATAGLVDETQKEQEARGNLPRQTLKDVWNGSAAMNDLSLVDNVFEKTHYGTVLNNLFFSWDEARLMEHSGTIAIGGHSLFHDGVFISPEYDGFSCPGDNLVSLNREVQGDFWGRPSFSRGPSLLNRAFVPCPELLQKLQALVPQNEDEAFAFLTKEENIRRLESVIEEYGEHPGQMENDDQWRDRIYSAMQDNQDMLVKELGHSVRSFCWPWGCSSLMAREAGQAAGFSVFYDTTRGPNPAGKPLGVHRMNFRTDAEKQVARIGVYSRPVWGAVYESLRSFSKGLSKKLRN